MAESKQNVNEAISLVSAEGNVEETLKKKFRTLEQNAKIMAKGLKKEEILPSNDESTSETIELAEQEPVALSPIKDDEWTKNLKELGADPSLLQ